MAAFKRWDISSRNGCTNTQLFPAQSLWCSGSLDLWSRGRGVKKQRRYQHSEGEINHLTNEWKQSINGGVPLDIFGVSSLLLLLRPSLGCHWLCTIIYISIIFFHLQTHGWLNTGCVLLKLNNVIKSLSFAFHRHIKQQRQKLIVLSFALSGNHDADKSKPNRKRSPAARGTWIGCRWAIESFAKVRV